MGEAKTVCPVCNRTPGWVHVPQCPRSQTNVNAMRFQMDALGAPRLLWRKGVVGFRRKSKLGPWQTSKITFNPGVPMVCHGTNPRAGGMPRDREAAAVFLQDIGLEKKPGKGSK